MGGTGRRRAATGSSARVYAVAKVAHLEIAAEPEFEDILDARERPVARHRPQTHGERRRVNPRRAGRDVSQTRSSHQARASLSCDRFSSAPDVWSWRDMISMNHD